MFCINFLRQRTREVRCSQLKPLNLQLWKESNTPVLDQVTTPRNGFTLTHLTTACHWQITGTTDCCTGFGMLFITAMFVLLHQLSQTP